MIFKTVRFSINLAVAGAIVMLISLIYNFIDAGIQGGSYNYEVSVSLYLFRLGFVIMLNAIVSYISLSIETIPKFLILIGRNTLLIYIVHLMILYGSAWNPGLALLFEKSLNVWHTVLTAVAMLLTMTVMVLLINRFKIKNKELVT